MKIINLSDFAQYLYEYLRVPVYQFRCSELYACYPEQADFCRPPQKYLDSLMEDAHDISYVCTGFSAYFGIVHTNDRSESLVIGPVSPLGFNRLVIEEMLTDYGIHDDQKEAFADFFSDIPDRSFRDLYRLLALVNLSLNERCADSETLARFQEDEARFRSQFAAYSAESLLDLKENESLYNNYLVESELCSYIEEGNLQKLKDFSSKAHQSSHYGTIASDNLRQHKNIFIIATILVSRAAIRGGLPAPLAYSLSDIYMNHAEHLQNVQAVIALLQTLQVDFCTRVAEAKAQEQRTSIIERAINYVHSNTNRNINTEDVAEAVGMSRSYLSTKFKEELGFSLSDFIRRCKLEEGKSLLQYSDKSISEISAYLCFSSQSHFQTLFKKQYGITPLQCRQQGGTLK